MNFDDNPEALLVLGKLREGRENLFITGEAGTGKTTLLRTYRQSKDRNGDTPVVLAPTGLAALLMGGQTIHSFFKFSLAVITPCLLGDDYRPGGFTKAAIRRLRVLVIDEVSMVRADLFDAMEFACRQYGPIPGEPWGGVKVVCFGDFMQLPPVVTPSESDFFNGTESKRGGWNSPHAFASGGWRSGNFQRITLRKNYRLATGQADYRELLDKVRFGLAEEADLVLLNSRRSATPPDDALRLYPRNAEADDFNDRKMRGLPGRGMYFDGVEGFYDQSGQAIKGSNIEGKSPERLPVPKTLLMKLGARVMLRVNDPEHGLSNGDIGEVVALRESGSNPATCVFRNGTVRLDVADNDWSEMRFSWEAERKRWKRWVYRRYSQIPLLPAWAMTVHKAQGQTVRGPLAVESDCFAPGQLYVALSRVTRLDDLHLLAVATRANIRVSIDCVEEMMKPDSWNTALELERMHRDRIAREAVQKVEMARIKEVDDLLGIHLEAATTPHAERWEDGSRLSPAELSARVEADSRESSRRIAPSKPAPTHVTPQPSGCLGLVIVGFALVGGLVAMA